MENSKQLIINWVKKAKQNLGRQTSNISALSSRNADKFEFLTWKYVLPEKDLIIHH